MHISYLWILKTYKGYIQNNRLLFFMKKRNILNSLAYFLYFILIHFKHKYMFKAKKRDFSSKFTFLYCFQKYLSWRYRGRNYFMFWQRILTHHDSVLDRKRSNKSKKKKASCTFLTNIQLEKNIHVKISSML